jgi:ribosomal-protein-alanine N-acetyltransferase
MSIDANLETPRLRLRPLAPESIDALIARDVMRLQALLGVGFPEPVQPFPLTDDALPHLREQLRAPDFAWSWIAARRDTGMAVCHLGFMRLPDPPPTVFAGWSTYPEQQRQGFATEAVGALVRFAFERLGVQRFECTIPPDNAPSLAVATRNGLVALGREPDDEVGEVIRLRRERAAP